MKITSYVALIHCAVLAGCGVSQDTSDAFVVRSSSYAVEPDTKVAISGDLIAFLADEGTTGTGGGASLNTDGDANDHVAIVIDSAHDTEVNTGVAARELAWIGPELYLVVSEAEDGRSWSLDGDMNDLVLVHWSRSDSMPTFVDTLDPSGTQHIVAAGTRVFFTASRAPTSPGESSLLYVTRSSPLIPAAVVTTDTVGPLRPIILGLDEDLIFLGLSESVEARDLNGDSASDGDLVFALLDGRAGTSVIRSTGLAIQSANGPFRANRMGADDWQIGFLVNEQAQGGTNLNAPSSFSPSWFPPQCAGHGDTDTQDDVLHYIRFAAWVQDPAQNPPRNTGLVGVQKIAITNGFIATITPESDVDGTLAEGTCDLNGDGDTNDKVARWTQIVASTAEIQPSNTVTNVHALFDVPGGTHGLAELSGRFVIVVSESADDLDIDGDGFQNFNLLGWLLPSTSSVAWQFRHSGDLVPVGASWVGEQRDRNRLGVALQEVVGQASINVGSEQNPGDLDLLDSVATFAAFTSSNTLTFPGVAIAVDPANAGIVIARGIGFYRVKEQDDSRDWDDDSDEDDQILWRTSLDQGISTVMGVLTSSARPAIDISASEGSPNCAAFVTDESKQGAAGTDLNRDGDRTDIVLQYFSF